MIFGITVAMLLIFILSIAYIGLKDQFLEDLAARQPQEDK